MSTIPSDSRIQSQFQFAGGGAKALAERSAAKQLAQREKIEEMHSGLRDTLPALKKLPASVRTIFNTYMGLIGACFATSTATCVISWVESRSAQAEYRMQVEELKASMTQMSAAIERTQSSLRKFKADDGKSYIVKNRIIMEGRDGRKYFEIQEVK